MKEIFPLNIFVCIRDSKAPLKAYHNRKKMLYASVKTVQFLKRLWSQESLKYIKQIYQNYLQDIC